MVWAKFGHPSQNLLFHIYGNVKITKNGRGNHPRRDMFTLKSSEREKTTFSSLTLFPVWGGHYGPDDHERPRCFRRVRATTTKIHDFVSVYV